ncbi:MAG: GAF domain-containing protein [Armatimonadetes bacterium]|nr:GAF domain-containing protein [Armatimonadota bacterium]
MRSREQLLALYEISRAINTLDVDSVLDRILEMALKIFKAEAGSVMLLENDILTIAGARGLAAEIVASTRVPLGEGIAGWVALTGEMLHLDGKVDDPRFIRLVERDEEITSSLCTPLKHRDRLIGVLMIRRGGPRPFSQDQLDFLPSVADLAAIALENARLYRVERERADQLDLERQKSEAILSSMADGVVVCDPAGRIVRSSAAARRMFSEWRSLEGAAVTELLPTLPFEHVFREALEGSHECAIRSGEWSDQVFRLTATALRLQERVEGAVLLLHDETARAQVERMKSEFLSMVSHELKTPITTIQAFLELLLFKDFPDDRKRKYLRICLDEAQRLYTLIEEILELSRLEAGQFAFQKSACRLDEIVRALLPGFAERSARHQFELEISEDIPPLQLDSTMMSQAVANLCSNALKYSPEGGLVRVTLRSEEHLVLLEVEDQGIGIDGDKIPYIFEKFYRVDNSLTRETGGTGLGLSNTRCIVEAHGGSIWVESEPGKGSRFVISLPIDSIAVKV